MIYQIPVFTKDPNGQTRKQKFIMGHRNWCLAELDETTGEFVFDIRVEREKGYGVTVGSVCMFLAFYRRFLLSFFCSGIQPVCHLPSGNKVTGKDRWTHGIRSPIFMY